MWLIFAGVEEDFKVWKKGFVADVFPVLRGETPLSGISGISGVSNELCGCGKKSKRECCKDQTTTVVQSEDNPEVTLPVFGFSPLSLSVLCQVLYETSSDDDDDDGEDVEGDGGMVKKMKSAKQRRLEEEEAVRRGDLEPREMVTPMLRKALSKQGRMDWDMAIYVDSTLFLVPGYRVVGSHSGVKLCRWTKSMLRGRGGCYKHTFYGIESHRCMETTPSLACANKCVFCWR